MIRFLARFNAAVAAARVGDPTQDVLMGPMLDARFAERYEEYLGWIQPHHTVQAASGRITPTTRGPASSATRAQGCTTTRWSSTAYAPATGSSTRRPSARSSA